MFNSGLHSQITAQKDELEKLESAPITAFKKLHHSKDALTARARAEFDRVIGPLALEITVDDYPNAAIIVQDALGKSNLTSK